MRKAIDALLFSGDFTPTTFDLAFFMHTLFRDEVERDARALEEARAADYREFLAEEAPKAPRRRGRAVRHVEPRLPRALRCRPRCLLRPWRRRRARRKSLAPPRAPARRRGVPAPRSGVARLAREAGAREAASRWRSAPPHSPGPG